MKLQSTAMLFLTTLATTGCAVQAEDGSRTAEWADEDVQPTGKGGGLANRIAGPSTDANPHKPGSTNGIGYHGGPIITGTPNIFYIWYGNWSGNSATTLLPKLVGDLSGSAYERINTTYTDGSGAHVSGLMTLGTQTTVSSYLGTSLSDAQILQVVNDAINAASAHGFSKGLAYDANGIYFVLTSKDVTASSGFCSQYCGWHTHGNVTQGKVRYSFVGNADRCPSSCAAQTTSPNGNPGADAMASIIAHESEEAISDPDGNAWYDSRGQENADKCAWTFGTTSAASNGSKYNLVGRSGTQWLIQQNWVNASGGYCAMSY
jgi:hypothetical protein